MSNDKGFFDTPEFRSLLKKYEQMKATDICSYLEIHELSDIHSYYLYNGNSHEAVNVIRLARQLYNGSPDVTKMEIRTMLTAGNPEAALPMFDTIEYDGDDDLLMLKAEVLLALKQYKESRKIANNILRKCAITDEISYDAMEILLDCGYAQEVLEKVEEGLKYNHNNKNLLEIKAESLIELQKTDEAISIYNHLLDKEPYSTFYWEQLGHIYYMIERYGKAIDCFEYELTIDANAEYAYMMQGYCYYRLKRYDKAIEIFDNFISKYPQSIIPRFYKALSLSHTGETIKALEEFCSVADYALLKQKDSIDYMLSMINMAILNIEIDNIELANGCMEHAILYHAYANDMKQIMLPGTPYYELRDKENMTFRDINITENKEWKCYELLFALGMQLIKAGYLSLALYPLYKAKAIAPDCSEIDASIAYIIYQRGDEKEKLEKLVANALEGKSNKLFELFDIQYDSDISVAEFMQKIGLQ